LYTTVVRVAYQTRQPVAWQGTTENTAGRTFEGAFAYDYLPVVPA